VLPFRDDASAYGTVSAQSRALYLDASLHSSMTKTDFDNYVNKLTILASYRGGSWTSGSTDQLNDLVNKLHAVAPAT
jgi:hypothetical protein